MGDVFETSGVNTTGNLSHYQQIIEAASMKPTGLDGLNHMDSQVDFGVNGYHNAKVSDLMKDPEFIKDFSSKLKDQYPELTLEQLQQKVEGEFNQLSPSILNEIDKDAHNLLEKVESQDIAKEQYADWNTLKDYALNHTASGQPVFNETKTYGKFGGYLGMNLNQDFNALPLTDREKYELAIAADNTALDRYHGHFVADENLRIIVAGDEEDLAKIFGKTTFYSSGFSSSDEKFGSTIYVLKGKDMEGKPMTAIIVPYEYLDNHRDEIMKVGRNYEMKANQTTIITPQGNINLAEELKEAHGLDITTLGYLNPPITQAFKAPDADMGVGSK